MSTKLDRMVQLIRDKWVPEFQLQISEDIPWATLAKSLSQAKGTIISTGGVYVKGDTPFTDHYGLGDPSYREIHIDTSLAKLDHFHEHYDHTNAYKDINPRFRTVDNRQLGMNLSTG
jgi:D-proline reductase (dithiol) PrdB